MKARPFSDAQTAFIVKQGEEGMPVAEICRKAGITQGRTLQVIADPPWRLLPSAAGKSSEPTTVQK